MFHDLNDTSMASTNSRPYTQGNAIKPIASWGAPCPYAIHAPIPDTKNATGTSPAATNSAPTHGTVIFAILMMLAPANSTPTITPTTHTTLLMIRASCIQNLPQNYD